MQASVYESFFMRDFEQLVRTGDILKHPQFPFEVRICSKLQS